ncbi:MAG: aminotransferase class I/II-fold pyridoxal phosphate-dependent enzyme [Gemmatimonadaceae bacterium]|nr:aminotransferase class I/II-fold pyridoxal phosphate-dependent enzyme [Gemmatimonadaceae bacterium]
MSEGELLRDDARAAGVQTLVDLLEYRAARQPSHVVFRFINSDGGEEAGLTFAALQRRARAIAVHLAEHVIPGDRVVLLVPPGLEYVAAFFGCLYAGVIAVPAYPPNPRRADPRVARIVADCGARIALVSDAFMARLDGWLALTPDLSALTWLDAGRLADGDATAWRAPSLTGRALAMLQYTSGSTGDPRGVMLSHANLLHNSAVIHRVSAHRTHDNGVFWLPPFHDMGLIGGILQPIYAGLSAALMAPATFLQRPLRWLEAMARYRATTSGAPNFAYDLCVERIGEAERGTLDLSHWRTSFNGAEPIRADTIERFSQAFAASGLRRDVILPCYGLAEGTLLVSGGPAERAPLIVPADRRSLESGELRAPDTPGASAMTLVASGEPIAEQTVAIVDPDTGTRCGSNEIGEIWVAGPSVAVGYWERPEASAATFHARLAGSGQSFLRTGDLGVLMRGQLIVTGRLKDLVILDGRNYYPHDIEVAAERSHPALRPGFTAAFGVAGDGRERLVLVAEAARQHKPESDSALFQAIRTELAGTIGVVPDEIVLIRQNTIPRTSSGKIQRRACRAAYLGDALDVVGRWKMRGSDLVAPNDAITAFVIDWVREELQVDPARLDPRTKLRELGLDSLAVTRLMVALEGRFGRRIDPAQLWEQPDIEALARHLASLDGRGTPMMPARVAERPSYGPPSAASTDVAQWGEYRTLRSRLDALADHGIASPFFHVHEGVTGSEAVVDGRTLINFANYNYLGLSGDADVTCAAQDAVARWGSSVSASRVVSGERPVHRELEREIARFVGAEDAVVYIGGVPANVSTISHLLGPEDVVLCDQLVHNSAMQGAEFSGARRLVFPHNDWASLDAMLTRVRGQHRRALVVIEGVYSADGDIPDLARFVEVKERHHAMLMVDEAHSIGVLGATGRGIAEHAGVDPRRVEIWMGTLSKSLASCGGYIAGSRALVEYLKYTSPGFVYSVGIPPSNAAAALAALRKLEAEPERVVRLHERAARFLALCRRAGLDTGASGGTPVIPVIVGDSLRAARLSALLFERGINVQPMVAPAVPEHLARLRFFIAATHTDEQLATTVTTLVEALAETEPDAVDVGRTAQAVPA